MMIKILQGAVVTMFILMVVVGLVVLFKDPGKMEAYKSFIATIFPIFMAQVVPALLGSPLTDYIRARASKVRGQVAPTGTP